MRTARFHYLRNFDKQAKRKWLPHEILAMPYPQRDSWPSPAQPRDEEELFDVQKDPQEFVNLAADPEYANIRKELAAKLNIDLLYLPPYSPNLQLIERLWKFIKKKCLYSHYYADFGAFKHAISTCLSHTHDLYKEELDSFLTLKFQTFKDIEKVKIMTL